MESKLEHLESMDAGVGLSDYEAAELAEALRLHASLLSQQEIFWKQRSRATWLAAGNHNTKFFHLWALARRKRNRIHYVLDESGNKIEETRDISNALPLCPVLEF